MSKRRQMRRREALEVEDNVVPAEKLERRRRETREAAPDSADAAGTVGTQDAEGGLSAAATGGGGDALDEVLRTLSAVSGMPTSTGGGQSRQGQEGQRVPGQGTQSPQPVPEDPPEDPEAIFDREPETDKRDDTLRARIEELATKPPSDPEVGDTDPIRAVADPELTDPPATEPLARRSVRDDAGQVGAGEPQAAPQPVPQDEPLQAAQGGAREGASQATQAESSAPGGAPGGAPGDELASTSELEWALKRSEEELQAILGKIDAERSGSTAGMADMWPTGDGIADMPLTHDGLPPDPRTTTTTPDLRAGSEVAPMHAAMAGFDEQSRWMSRGKLILLLAGLLTGGTLVGILAAYFNGANGDRGSVASINDQISPGAMGIGGARPTTTGTPVQPSTYPVRLIVGNARGIAGQPIPLNIAFAGADRSRAELVHFVGVHDALRLSAGFKVQAGSWLVPASAIPTLTLTAAPNYSGRSEIAAQAFDADFSRAVSATVRFQVDVSPPPLVAPAPSAAITGATAGATRGVPTGSTERVIASAGAAGSQTDVSPGVGATTGAAVVYPDEIPNGGADALEEPPPGFIDEGLSGSLANGPGASPGTSNGAPGAAGARLPGTVVTTQPPPPVPATPAAGNQTLAAVAPDRALGNATRPGQAATLGAPQNAASTGDAQDSAIDDEDDEDEEFGVLPDDYAIRQAIAERLRRAATANPASAPSRASAPSLGGAPATGGGAARPSQLELRGRELIRRGNVLMRKGDIVGARRLFKEATISGLARAYLAYGRSFDPNYLDRIPGANAAPDPERALELYRKAIEGGLGSAKVKIENLLKRLARTG